MAERDSVAASSEESQRMLPSWVILPAKSRPGASTTAFAKSTAVWPGSTPKSPRRVLTYTATSRQTLLATAASERSVTFAGLSTATPILACLARAQRRVIFWGVTTRLATNTSVKPLGTKTSAWPMLDTAIPPT